jgi:hypothetical protein
MAAAEEHDANYRREAQEWMDAALGPCQGSGG